MKLKIKAKTILYVNRPLSCETQTSEPYSVGQSTGAVDRNSVGDDLRNIKFLRSIITHQITAADPVRQSEVGKPSQWKTALKILVCIRAVIQTESKLTSC